MSTCPGGCQKLRLEVKSTVETTSTDSLPPTLMWRIFIQYGEKVYHLWREYLTYLWKTSSIFVVKHSKLWWCVAGNCICSHFRKTVNHQPANTASHISQSNLYNHLMLQTPQQVNQQPFSHRTHSKTDSISVHGVQQAIAVDTMLCSMHLPALHISWTNSGTQTTTGIAPLYTKLLPTLLCSASSF